MSGLEPKFFSSSGDFRKWLKKNHDKRRELIVGFYKVGTGKPCMTWSESVDQALCFGWIDGIRKKLDDESYTIRFTPRRRGSTWSAINIKKIEGLKREGLMGPAGLEAFKARRESRSAIYSYEKPPASFSKELEKRFKKHRSAWRYFNAQAPSYRRLMMHFVMDAKQEKTRISRLEKLILASESGERL